jgi:hypothetical protein
MNNSRQLNLILKLKDEVSGSLDKVNSKMQDLKPTFQKMALIGTASFLAIGTGIYKATQQAVNAQEIYNKFDVVFSDVGKAAENVALDLRDNFGMAESTAKDLLSATGDMLTGFGLTGGAALDLAERTNKLAVDLASFTNIQGGAERASTALTKALLGERESVKELGIAILEEDVKAKVLSMRATGELTDETERQARALATLEIAISQSKNAIGDFARTQDSLANQQRTLNERLKEVVETLGVAFIPLATELMNAIIPLVATIATWVKENPKLTRNIALVGLAVSALVAGIGLLGLVLPGVITLFGMLTISMLPLIATIAIVTLIFGALAVYWVKNFDTMMMGVDVFMEGWTKFMDHVILGADVVEEHTNRMAKSWRNYFDDVILGTNVVEESFSNFINSASSLNNSATSKIGTAWNLLFDNLYLGIQVAFEGITTFLTGGVNLIITIFESMANSIISSINGILDGINKVARRLESFGIDVPTIQLLSNLKIPRLAEGGVVNKPTLAMIGEGNESEAVLPLSKLNKFSGGGGVTINISTMVGEEEYAEKMGDKIIQSLKQNQLMTSV